MRFPKYGGGGGGGDLGSYFLGGSLSGVIVYRKPPIDIYMPLDLRHHVQDQIRIRGLGNKLHH